MPEPGHAPDDSPFEMRLSVPAGGGLRDIVGELTTKVAERLGTNAPDAQSLGAAIAAVASRLARGGASGEHDITVDFRQREGELVIEARCQDRLSEIRHPLPG